MTRQRARYMEHLLGIAQPIEPSDIADAYWRTGATVQAIASQFAISVPSVAKAAGPAALAGLSCPACSQPISVINRDAAMRVVSAPFYPADALQGWVPGCIACAGPTNILALWYVNGHIVSGTPGGGAYGDVWRQQGARSG